MKTQDYSSLQGNLAIKVQNHPDFTGRDLYVGIDIHKRRWQVAVYYEGLVLSNTSIEGNADTLITHLHNRYGDASFHCVYESCAWGFALCRWLMSAGMECILVNGADIPGTGKERRSKTDKVDACKLARHLAAGLLQPVYVPSEKLKSKEAWYACVKNSGVILPVQRTG